MLRRAATLATHSAAGASAESWPTLVCSSQDRLLVRSGASRGCDPVLRTGQALHRQLHPRLGRPHNTRHNLCP
jgi:hypothetical protein